MQTTPFAVRGGVLDVPRAGRGPCVRCGRSRQRYPGDAGNLPGQPRRPHLLCAQCWRPSAEQIRALHGGA